MKKYIGIFIIFCLCFSFSTALMAQKKPKKTKEEIALEKEWAKKLKLMKPLDYKQMVEEKEALQTKVTELEGTNTSLKYEFDAKDAEIAKLKKELEDYKSGMAPDVAQGGDSTAADGTTPAAKKTVAKKGVSKGVVYKVQVGSFKNKD